MTIGRVQRLARIELEKSQSDRVVARGKREPTVETALPSEAWRPCYDQKTVKNDAFWASIALAGRRAWETAQGQSGEVVALVEPVPTSPASPHLAKGRRRNVENADPKLGKRSRPDG